jgi:hypothetical protein
VEQRAVADSVWLLDKGEAAVGDRPVKAADGLKAAVGERFVDEGPKMFSRL